MFNPERYSFIVPQSSTWDGETVQLLDSEGVPIPIPGFNARLGIFVDPTSTTPFILLDSAVVNVDLILNVDTVTAIISPTISAQKMSTFPCNGDLVTYYYSLIIYDASLPVVSYRLLEGDFTVTPALTSPF